jgi:spore germination protein GerM
MLKSSKYGIVTMMFILLFSIAGCDSAGTAVDKKSSSDTQSSTEQQKKSEVKPDQTKTTETIKVYFPNDEGTKLIAESKKIKNSGADQYTETMNALLEGSKDKKVVSIIPAGTKLRSVKVDKGIAYVDFSQELIKKFNGGSTGELMLVGSIVDTLTEYPEIKGVQILVEGKKVETIAGHMDTSEPLKRMKDLLKN